MAETLEDLVQFRKSIYKLVKSQIKDLRKSAKKARKKEDRELPADQAREQLDDLLPLLAKNVDTAAALADADAHTRVDLEVDGQTVLEDVPLRAVLELRKQLKRLRKLGRELTRLHDQDDFSELAKRTQRLYEATDAAVRQANAAEVDEREISGAIVAYLTGGSKTDAKM